MSAKLLKLIAAIENDSIEKAKSLLNPGFLSKPANVNGLLFGGITPLMIAAKKGNIEIIRMLLAAGADANAKTEDDKTALMVAVENSNAQIVEFLLDAGADINAKTKDSKMEWVPIAGTISNPSVSLQNKKVFIEDTTALMLAVEHGNEKMVSLILEKKPEINFHSRYGKTPLIKAIEKNNKMILKYLVDAGAEVNLNDILYHTEWSSLASESTLEVIRFLLDSGADVNGMSSLGKTVLMTALTLHSLPVMQLLVESGADINIKNDNGETVLFDLATYGKLEDQATLEYLCQKGLEVNVYNHSGKSPLIGKGETLYTFSRILIQAGVRYIPGDSHALFMKAIDNNDQVVVQHLLENGAETEWEEERQGEDEWGRYSACDKYNMLAYAKKMNAADIVKYLDRYSSQKN